MDFKKLRLLKRKLISKAWLNFATFWPQCLGPSWQWPKVCRLCESQLSIWRFGWFCLKTARKLTQYLASSSTNRAAAALRGATLLESILWTASDPMRRTNTVTVFLNKHNGQGEKSHKSKVNKTNAILNLVCLVALLCKFAIYCSKLQALTQCHQSSRKPSEVWRLCSSWFIRPILEVIHWLKVLEPPD